MNKDELMNKIHALTFALTEAQLFLDTHPECRNALDYYRRLVDEADAAMTEYNNRFGPLVPEATAADRWTWIDGPWPWQHGVAHNGMMPRTDGGKK